MQHKTHKVIYLVDIICQRIKRDLLEKMLMGRYRRKKVEATFLKWNKNQTYQCHDVKRRQQCQNKKHRHPTSKLTLNLNNLE